MTANSGYSLSTSVGGTCPAGSWSGSTYTTGAVTGSCSVSFAAVAVATPTVTGIMPTSGSITGGTVVDIAGTNFTSGATVSFGATAATVISASPTSIKVTAPAHASGFADVTVTVSGATSATSSADRFVYGAQQIYVSRRDPAASSVYRCTHSLTGLSSCAVASGTSLNTASPTAIAITAVGSSQYAYVLDSDNRQIYACQIDPSSALFVSCSLTSVSVPNTTFLGLNFATFGGIQHAYLAGYDYNSGGGVLFKCTISSTGDLISCATAASGTPPWNSGSAPQASLEDIVFQRINGTPYAYVSDSDSGFGSGNIYKCQVQSDGDLNGSACAAMSHIPPTSSPAKMSVIPIGGTLYTYYGQTNGGGVVDNCAMDNITGDFTACYSSGHTPQTVNDSIAIAEISGQLLIYLADSHGRYPYYCSFNDSSSNYTVDASSCVQMTTGGSGGLDLYGVAGGTIGFIAN